MTNLVTYKQASFLIFLCSMLTLGAATSIPAPTLTLAVQGGQTKLSLRQRLTLILTIENATSGIGKINLDGLGEFNEVSREQSNSIRVINGVTTGTLTHQLVLLPTREGSFTLGPARLHHQGLEISSNTLAITVAKAAANPDAPTFKLIASRNEVVVGEPIEVVKLLQSPQQLLDVGLGQIEHADFDSKETKPGVIRKENIRGIPYVIAEQRIALTPHREGTFTLGPAVSEMHVPGARRNLGNNGLFDESFFNAFFGPAGERIQVESNELKIVVKPLPNGAHAEGVGVFTGYHAKLSAGEAHVNEPITLTLGLEGCGNFGLITVPKLKLPASIKSYESKNETLERPEFGFCGGKKHFEFVLQAGKSGHYTVPAQSFTYFDTASRSIKTISTQPQTLLVTGQAGGHTTSDTEKTDASSQASPEPDETDTSDTQETTDSKTAHPELVEGQQAKSTVATREAVPLWLFILLLIIPLLAIARPAWRRVKKFYTGLRHQRKQAERHTEKTLKALIKARKHEQLGDFFLAVLGKRMHIQSEAINTDLIEQFLTQQAWEHDKIDEFVTFMGDCSGLRLGLKKFTHHELDALDKRAQYWFVKLNR